MDRKKVLLLRDIVGSRSLVRFADGLERSFSESEAVELIPVGRVESVPNNFSGIHIGLRVGNLIRYSMSVRVAHSRVHPDLVHFSNYGSAQAASLLPPQVALVTCHDLMLALSQGSTTRLNRHRRLSGLAARVTLAFLRRSAHVVCPSAATRDDVIRLAGIRPESVSVVRNGVDGRFRFFGDARGRRSRRTIPGASEHLLLHVSTGGPYKNVDGTLRVLAVLLACGANVRLIRVGRLLPHKSLALAHALGVERAVVELGHVSDDRLAELYNAADVLLFPSLYEGFGWPVLEAMAAGTPVVVSTCPALSELVGDAALKRPATDIRGLSEAVLDILRSPSLARHLRYAGIERARGFSWRATMAGYELAYQNAIENRRLSATD